MKHLKLFLAASAISALALTSCSNEPKLLTEAEVTKKVADATAAKTKELEAKLDAECSSKMDAMVNTAVDSIVMAKKAEMATPTKK